MARVLPCVLSFTLAATFVATSPLLVPASASSSAAEAQTGPQAAPQRAITVTGTGTSTYPTFSPDVSRYAVTTSTATDGSLAVDATTTDPNGKVWVDGRLASGRTTVTGLVAGDEVSIRVADSSGVGTYAFVYLPAGFPALEATTTDPAQAPDWVALTLGPIYRPGDRYQAVVDSHGVPGHVRRMEAAAIHDLKPAPGGWTMARSVAGTSPLSYEFVRYDKRFREIGTLRTRGLVNTDFHEAIVRPDGSHVLMAYERHATKRLPDPQDPSKTVPQTDSVIQEIAPDGTVLHEWNSGDHVDPVAESINIGNGDYAHLNSVHQLPNGDLLASFRHLSSVYRIDWNDDATDGFSRGEVVWKLGGRRSDFTFPDDPVPSPGPCAQHTAEMMPNGNVVLFDNGAASGGPFCVDPAQPDGPFTARPQSRAVEYDLDVAAGTASLVWSSDDDLFSMWAGSSYRLANGSTLLGYMATPGAISRVAAAGSGETVWQLRDATATSTGWFASYRTHLAPNPDAEPPTARIEAPATGTSVAVGERLVLGATCTDKGGSTLKDCSVGGVRSGETLDTSTPGTHTVTLTAVDGAGLTATDTLTYTVVAPAVPPPPSVDPPAPAPAPAPATGRPDLAVRTPKGWAGDGSYATRQLTRHTLRLRKGVTRMRVRVTNRGSGSEAVAVRAARSDKRYRVRYLDGRKDVTRQVIRGTYRTRVLAPGESVRLRVVVRPRRAARPGTVRTLRVTAFSPLAPTVRDAVRLRVKSRR